MAGKARAHFQIRDVDHGYKDLIKVLYQGEKPVIKVGILAKDGGEAHKNPDGSASALTVADVATMHEFGLGVPERSFLRAWFDTYDRQAKDIVKALLQRAIRGEIDKYQALEQAGAVFAARVQGFIQAGKVQPPLEEATVKRKGSSVPLLNTGQTVSAISYAVEGVKKPPKPAKQGRVSGFASKKSKAARKRLGKKALRLTKRAAKFAKRVSYKGGKKIKKVLRSVSKKKGRGK